MRIEFWSNTECGTSITGLIRELRAAGHDAVQCFQVSSTDYRAARGLGARVWVRARMYVLYPVQLIVAFIAGRSPRVSVVTTNTFFAPLLASLVASKRTRVVHLVWDLFPDALVESGAIRRGGIVDRILGFATLTTFRRSAVNVFLGSHLLRCAELRYGRIPNSVIIPVGADGTPFHEGGPPAGAPGEPVTVLYCGNMGRMHDVSTLTSLLTGAGQTPERSVAGPPSVSRPLHFVFHATGSGYPRLKAALGLVSGCESRSLNDRVRVTAGGGLSDSAWVRVMKSADIALVTMAPGAERVVMPSKAYSAMVAGQAVLAICPRQSDLAETVLTHDCGWVVEPGDTEALGRVVDIITRDRSEVRRKQQNAWSAGHAHYNAPALASQWLSTLSLD